MDKKNAENQAHNLPLQTWKRWNGMKNWRGSPNVTLINACSLTTVPNAEKYPDSSWDKIFTSTSKVAKVPQPIGPEALLIGTTK